MVYRSMCADMCVLYPEKEVLTDCYLNLAIIFFINFNFHFTLLVIIFTNNFELSINFIRSMKRYYISILK